MHQDSPPVRTGPPRASSPSAPRASTPAAPLSSPPPGGPVRVLVVEDDDAVRRAVVRQLRDPGFELVESGDGEEALELLSAHEFDVVLADVVMPRAGGMELLRRVRERAIDVEVIMMTAHNDLSLAFEAVQAGAFHFLKKPFSTEELRLHVLRASERQRILARTRQLEAQLDGARPAARALGTSRAMREVREFVQRVAPQMSSVLVTGECGTGKEVIAREIHARSTRARGPFIAVNCGALPETLVETILFGSARGAYSGAEDRPGHFEAANGGTIFLDEIGELPKAQQVKFLRVLQERKVTRVGESREREVNVRVIAATNVDIKAAVAEQRFRQDLYFRLRVQAIQLPPLRERREDIQLLAYHFLQKHGPQLNPRVHRISPIALRALESYEWPGNVRELESAIYVGLGAAAGDTLELDGLPAELRAVQLTGPALPSAPLPAAPPPVAPLAPPPFAPPPALATLDYTEARRRCIADFERAFVKAVLDAAGGNISQAARLAGLDRSNFRRVQRRVAGDPGPDDDDERRPS
ncbi:MAG: sigma-54 dependent transcriptional regulator [Polyangiales bacterium]